MRLEARGGTVKVTTDGVRERVLPYLRDPMARSAVESILERADEVRIWDLTIPDAPDAEEELVSWVMRAGGPAISSAGRPIRLYTVEVRSDETHDEDYASYWSDRQPEIGDVIEADGMLLEIENVSPSPETAVLDCVRVSPESD